ncbi:hypothetical protein ACM66B_003999 [Microbotryomycetes sp. NB124-2]
MLTRHAASTRQATASDGHALVAAIVTALVECRTRTTTAATPRRRVHSTVQHWQPHRSHQQHHSQATTSAAHQQDRTLSARHSRNFSDKTLAHTATGPHADTLVTLIPPGAEHDASFSRQPPAANILWPVQPQQADADNTACSSPQPPTVDVAVQTLAASLRESTRLADPSDSATTILASQRAVHFDYPSDHAGQHNRHQHHSQPLPPPPIAFLPQRSRANPHMLTAFLLQALFLGASAIGLMVRKKVNPAAAPEFETTPSSAALSGVTNTPIARHVEQEQGETGTEEVQALNLLLMSHAVETDQALAVSDEHVSSFMSIVARFVQGDHAPVTNTAIALLALARPTTQIASTESRLFHQIRSTLVRQAWQILQACDGLQRLRPVHRSALASSFIQYVASHADDLPVDTVHNVLGKLSTAGEDLNEPTALALGHLAISQGLYALLPNILETPHLRSEGRIELVNSTLQAMAQSVGFVTDKRLVQSLCSTLCSSLNAVVAFKDDSLDDAVDRAISSIWLLLDNPFHLDETFEAPLTLCIKNCLGRNVRAFPREFTHRFARRLVDLGHEERAVAVVDVMSRHDALERYHLESLLQVRSRAVVKRVWSQLVARDSEFGPPTVETLYLLLTGLVRQKDKMDGHLLAHRAINHIDLVFPELELGRELRNERRPTKSKVTKPAQHDARMLAKCRNKLLELAVRHSPQRKPVHTVLAMLNKPKKRRKEADEADTDGRPDWATRTVLLARPTEAKLSKGIKARVKTGQKRQIQEVAEGYATLVDKFDGPAKSASPTTTTMAPALHNVTRHLSAVRDGDVATVVGLNVARNVLLRTVTRSFKFCDVDKVVALCLSELGVDVRSDEQLEQSVKRIVNGRLRDNDVSTSAIAVAKCSSESATATTLFARVREPRYKMLLKALRNRGERHLFHSRLLRAYRAEQFWIESRQKLMNRSE